MWKQGSRGSCFLPQLYFFRPLFPKPSRELCLYDDYRPNSIVGRAWPRERAIPGEWGGLMSQIDVPLAQAGFGQTRRSDNWWIQPLVVFLGLSAFIVYSTWAALQGQHF